MSGIRLGLSGQAYLGYAPIAKAKVWPTFGWVGGLLTAKPSRTAALMDIWRTVRKGAGKAIKLPTTYESTCEDWRAQWGKLEVEMNGHHKLFAVE